MQNQYTIVLRFSQNLTFIVPILVPDLKQFPRGSLILTVILKPVLSPDYVHLSAGCIGQFILFIYVFIYSSRRWRTPLNTFMWGLISSKFKIQIH